MRRYPRHPAAGRYQQAEREPLAATAPSPATPSRWAKTGVYGSWLAGYLLVLWAFAELLTLWLWPLGIGVALLGVVGLRQVGLVLWRGGYFLARQGPGEAEGAREGVG